MAKMERTERDAVLLRSPSAITATGLWTNGYREKAVGQDGEIPEAAIGDNGNW